jgi:hypothetical protein
MVKESRVITAIADKDIHINKPVGDGANDL